MAEFTFNCPQCGQSVEADESFCGQTVECPRCGNGIVVPSIKSSSVSEAKTQPLYCPNCGNACEVDGELAIGQHLICPYCSEKFAYPGTEQGSESFPQGGHAEERRSEEITAKCPHCGTLYEVEQSYLGQEVTCDSCGRNFVIADIKSSVSDSGTGMTEQESVADETAGNGAAKTFERVKTPATEAKNKTIIWWKNSKEGREAFCSKAKAATMVAKSKLVTLWNCGAKGKVILGVGALLAFCICVVLPIMSYRNADAQYELDADSARVKGVQLWAGGPIWAEKNVGADKPEDAGLYFWWGDTIGYKCVDGKWVASDGSSSNFNFDLGNCLTYRKEMGQLYPSQDAAHKYLGGDWRMPTKAELESLLEYCDWKWTQVGGVGGYVVTGRDDFAANSIFLPASGFGGGTERHLFGERGFCGSSSPDSVYSDRAWCLIFDSGKRSISCNGRTYGFSVRPVQDAVKWFRKAAEQGDVEAQFGLGVCYSGGKGVAKDTVEAVKWYRKAAEQGFASAQCKLGLCYAKGDGVEKDQATAVSWYRKAANQGHAEAQNLLGVCYSDGKGVAKDKSEAAKWFRKAAEQGHWAAIYNLTTDNDAERVKWFRKAAEHGDRTMQLALGKCYFDGKGVAKDKSEAVKWYRKAAEQGDAEAQYKLGGCYLHGEGVARDKTEALKWWRKAAEQGHEEARFFFEVLKKLR